jgi:hypothetical protein
MRLREIVIVAAVFVSSCASHDVDAARCASAVLRAARDVAAECLIQTEETCQIDESEGDQ